MALPSRDLNFTFLSPSSVPRTGPAKKRTRTSAVKTTRRRQSAMPVLRQYSSADIVRALSRPTASEQVSQRLARISGDNRGVLGKAISSVVSPVGQFGLNALQGAAPIIPGLSRLIYEQGKDLGQMALSPLPGIDFAPAANRSAERTVGLIKGLGEDISYTFGPLVEGDFGTAARRVYNDPVRTLGTAAIFVPAVGSAVGASARAAGRAAAGTKFGEAAARFGSKQKSYNPEVDGPVPPRRYREPERIEAPSETISGAPAVIERKRRPRSANPLTREFQRYVSDPAISTVRRGVGSIGGRRNPLSPERRFNRAVEKGTIDRAYNFVNEFDQSVAGSAVPFSKIVRKVPKIASKELGSRKLAPVVYAAVALRAMGLNNVSRTQTSRTWGRDSMLEQWRKNLDEGVEIKRERDAIEKNVDSFEKIPDEWLDPDTAPVAINELVKQTERILDESTDLKTSAGAITGETAEFAKRRAQYIAAGVFDEATRSRRLFAKNVSQRAAIAKLGSQIAGSKRAVDNAKLSKDAAALKKAQSRLRRQTDEMKRLRNAAAITERKAKEWKGQVEARFSPEMEPGSYFPSVSAIPKKRSKKAPAATATPRMTMKDAKQNRGIILRQGSPSFAPDVALGALRDATDVALRNDALTEIVSRYAIKDANGVAITGRQAELTAQYHGDLYELKTKKELLKMMSSQEGKDVYRQLESLIDEAKFPDHKYLIPKAAIRGWQSVLGSRQNIIDQINGYWKAGVLAISPRWYVQNIFGNSLQFILGAGLDLQAIGMARSKKYRDSILSDIDAHGLSAELGEFARREGLRPSRNPLRRLIVAGYRLNARFEAFPRRAMYYHAVKKQLKEEKLAGFRTNSAVLSQAWLEVGKAAGRGEKWANDLVDAARIETTRFMGEYTRYNRFERTVMRRAFPFYGWMRTVLRLAFALPVKHPKRAGLLAAAASATYYMYNDDESQLLDPYAGLVDGERFIQTSILMPQETLTSFMGPAGRVLEKAVSGDISGAVPLIGQAALRQSSPLFTAPTALIAGRSGLNIPFMFAPGSGDEIPDPRNPGRTYTIDPVTGQRVDVTRTPSLSRLVEQQFPLAMNIARLASPLDSTLSADKGLEDVAWWHIRGRPKEDMANLFIPKSPTTPQPIRRTRAGDISGLLAGLPIWQYDPRAAALRSMTEDVELAKAQVTDFKRRARNAYLLTNNGR